MSDDYLWSGGGTPDPEVQRLEGLLRRFRHEPRTWRGSPARRPRRAAAAAWIGVAAALVLALVGGVRLAFRPAAGGWEVVALAGSPTIGSTGVHDPARLAVGARLETDAASRARLRIG